MKEARLGTVHPRMVRSQERERGPSETSPGAGEGEATSPSHRAAPGGAPSANRASLVARQSRVPRPPPVCAQLPQAAPTPSQPPLLPPSVAPSSQPLPSPPVRRQSGEGEKERSGWRERKEEREKKEKKKKRKREKEKEKKKKEKEKRKGKFGQFSSVPGLWKIRQVRSVSRFSFRF